MAIFDTMQFIKPDVQTICIGMAASMGAFLLAAGTKGKRYALPNAEVMIHQPLGGAQGQATEIEIAAKRYSFHSRKTEYNSWLSVLDNLLKSLQKIQTVIIS